MSQRAGKPAARRQSLGFPEVSDRGVLARMTPSPRGAGFRLPSRPLVLRSRVVRPRRLRPPLTCCLGEGAQVWGAQGAQRRLALDPAPSRGGENAAVPATRAGGGRVRRSCALARSLARWLATSVRRRPRNAQEAKPRPPGGHAPPRAPRPRPAHAL